MPEYGQKEYWEGRYKGLRTVGSGGGGQPEDTRDWYMGYATLKAVLKPYLKSSEVRRPRMTGAPPPPSPHPHPCGSPSVCRATPNDPTRRKGVRAASQDRHQFTV